MALNPGHSEDDEKSQTRADFRNAMFLNLRHELGEYPFYMLAEKLWAEVDPRFGKFSLKNPQCGHISEGNTAGNSFGQILMALK